MNFFGLFNKKSTPIATGVRRIGQSAPNKTVAETSATAQPHGEHGPAPVDIHEIQQIGHFRGVLNGFVSDANRPYCVVIDTGLNTVKVLATLRQAESGALISVTTKLRDRQLTLEKTLTTTVHVIRQIYEAAESKKSITRDDASQHTALFDDLVRGAYRRGATDIHFTINETGQSHVALRIFGRLMPWVDFEQGVLLNAISAAYNSKSESGTNSAGTYSVSRGTNTMMAIAVDGKRLKLRFSSYPTIHGGIAVMRLLESGAKTHVPSFAKLGYAPSQILELERALAKNDGMLLIAGSTGSGKSTTLRTMLDALPYKSRLARFAVEDPSEYDLPGVQQLSIQRGPDDPEAVVRQKFLSALRQLMRLDPDVLMLGEIRDTESAEIATEMTLTGHRVLSTIHASSVIELLTRATSRLINIDPQVLATRRFLNAAIYQKLMPVLCDCKLCADEVLDQHTRDLLRSKFGIDTSTVRCANPEGCERCRIDGIAEASGTRGLTVVAEVLIPTEDMLAAMRDKDWNAVERTWRAQRTAAFDDPDMHGKTAFEHALYKMSIGLIDPRDIEADFDSFDAYHLEEIRHD